MKPSLRLPHRGAGLALALGACALAGAWPAGAQAADAWRWWSQVPGGRVSSVVEGEPGGLAVRVRNEAAVPVSVRWWLVSATNLAQVDPATAVVPSEGEAVVAHLRVLDPLRVHSYRYRYRYAYGRPGLRPDGQSLALPFGPFQRVRVMQGPNGRFSHQGKEAYDFDLALGTWVLAARGGRVVKVHRDATTGGLAPSFLVEQAVNSVLVAHEDGSFGAYLHFMPHGVAVAVGQQVAVGDRLGQAGATGFASGPHLHFELNAAGLEAETRSFPVRFRTAEAPEGQSLRGGEWVVAP